MDIDIRDKARFLSNMVHDAANMADDILHSLEGYDTSAYHMARLVSYSLDDIEQSTGDIEAVLNGGFCGRETTMTHDDTNDAVEDFHCKVDLLNHWLWKSKVSDEDYTAMMRQALDEMMAHVMGKEER